MLSIIPQAREDVSKYAPKIKTVKIDPEKIGEVIGSGGKTIRNISATTGATVDVAEDGTVSISSISEEAVEKAANWVDLITRELHKGEVFEGIVKRIVSFGAFVEIVPGKEGLVHVSEMSTEYVRDPHDVLKIGQTVKVNVKEMDEHGRINLSMLFGERPERTREEGPARPPREERPRDDRREFQRRDDRAGSRRESGSRGGSRPFRRDSRRGGRAPFDSLRPDTRERR